MAVSVSALKWMERMAERGGREEKETQKAISAQVPLSRFPRAAEDALLFLSPFFFPRASNRTNDFSG